jgi:hypothetical protein
MALLEAEVDHLYDSQELLGNDLNVDLLLGTQGWRRFVVVKQGEFLQESGIKAERVLGVHKSIVRYMRYLLLIILATPCARKK